MLTVSTGIIGIGPGTVVTQTPGPQVQGTGQIKIVVAAVVPLAAGEGVVKQTGIDPLIPLLGGNISPDAFLDNRLWKGKSQAL